MRPITPSRAAVLSSLGDVKKALGLQDTYAILDARLVYAGPLDPYSDEAKEQSILYRPMWEVKFHISPGRRDRGNIRIVFLDAVSGDYVGHIPR